MAFQTLTTNADIHTGTSSADTIFGFQGGDTILGAGGNDFILGDWFLPGQTPDNGADSLDGGDGNDTIFAGGGNDTIDGGAGDDWLIAEAGDDVVNMGGATTYQAAFGGAGNDIINGGDGQDFIFGESGADILNGGGGNDRIHADSQDLFVSGGAGTFDTLVIDDPTGALSVINLGAASNQNQTENVVGGATDDIIGPKVTGFEAVDGSLASSNLALLADINTGTVLIGGSGNDTIYGGNGGDILQGNAGNDVFVIGSPDGYDTLQNDSIDGGAGRDVLAITVMPTVLSGAGAQYEIGATQLAGVRNVEVLDTTALAGAPGGGVRIVLTDALIAQMTGGTSIELRTNAADVVDLRGVTTASQVVINTSTNTNVLAATNNSGPGGNAAGTAMSVATGVSTAPAAGNLINPNNVNVSIGQTGGSSGQGSTIADTGLSDTINGSAGPDTINLTTGSDSVTGGAGSDLFAFANGANFTAADTIVGGDGVADTLALGAGAATVNAALVANVSTTEVIRTTGAGNTIVVTDAMVTGMTGGNTLTIDARANTTVTNTAQTSATSLVLGNFGTPGALSTVTLGNSGTTGSTVTLSNNTTPLATGLSSLNINDSAGNDVVTGSILGEVIGNGSGGNDSFSGGEGADTLVAGGGNDTLLGGNGDDVIRAGGGNDSVVGGAGDDSMQFLAAGSFNAATGGDTVNGGDGADTLVIARDAGNPLLAANWANLTNTETIVLADATGGTAPADNTDTILLNDAIVAAQGGTITITENLGTGNLAGLVAAPANLATTLQLSGVTGTNRVNFTAADAAAANTDGDNVLIGTGVMNLTFGANTLDNVTVSGSAPIDSSDTIVGGTRTTGVAVGNNADTTVLSLAAVQGDVLELSGAQTVNFSSNAANVTGFEAIVTGINTTQAGVYNITLTSASVATSEINNAGAVGATYTAAAPQIFQIGTADAIADAANTADRLNVDASNLSSTQALVAAGTSNTAAGVSGTSHNDTIIGGAGRDTINGGLGDDSLVGNGGNDTITAGLGADTVWAGLGSDTIDVTAGAAEAVAAQDVLVFRLTDLADTDANVIQNGGGTAAGADAGDDIVWILGDTVGQFTTILAATAAASTDLAIEVTGSGTATVTINTDNDANFTNDATIASAGDTITVTGVSDFNGDGILDLQLTIA